MKAYIQEGLTWKQKLAFSFPLDTGGSCRKSPHMISWMPPNGSVDLLNDLQESRERTRMDGVIRASEWLQLTILFLTVQYVNLPLEKMGQKKRPVK